MPKLPGAGKLLFTASFVVALSFGARTALAAPSSSAPCAYDPDAGLLGTCSTSSECTQTCTDYYGVSTRGICNSSKCCVCL